MSDGTTTKWEVTRDGICETVTEYEVEARATFAKLLTEGAEDLELSTAQWEGSGQEIFLGEDLISSSDEYSGCTAMEYALKLPTAKEHRQFLGYYRQSDIEDHWLVYDGGIIGYGYGMDDSYAMIGESNEQAVIDMLDGERSDLWTIVDGCIVFDPSDESICAIVADIANTLEQYPILDDDDHSRREWEALQEQIADELSYLDLPGELRALDGDTYARMSEDLGWYSIRETPSTERLTEWMLDTEATVSDPDPFHPYAHPDPPRDLIGWEPGEPGDTIDRDDLPGLIADLTEDRKGYARVFEVSTDAITALSKAFKSHLRARDQRLFGSVGKALLHEETARVYETQTEGLIPD